MNAQTVKTLSHKITVKTLVEILSGISKPTPIGFSALTNAMERKTGCPFAEILKLSSVHPMTATDYGRMVNAQLAREGKEAEFVPASPRYERVSPALVRFNGTGSLALPVAFSSQCKQARKPVYLVRKAIGDALTVVSHETVAPWTDKPVSSARQEAAGVESQIVWRTYGVKSIVRLSLGGKVYRVRQD